MHWAIDAQRLAGQRLGVGRYIEYLVLEWDRMAPADDRFTLFVRQPLETTTLSLSPRYTIREVGPSLTGKLWQNLVLPRHSRTADALFCPSYSIPLRYRGACVVAIHSLNEAESGTHPWWYRLTYTPLYKRSAERADRVIVPSESTSRDIQEWYGIGAEKIDVVPLGVDEVFRPVDDEQQRSRTRRSLLGEDVPYVVFVGKLSQRRNIPKLIEAFGILKRRTKLPHRLLLFGPNHLNLPLGDIAAHNGVSDAVVQLDGRVAQHRDLAAVYGAADLFVSASSYEGFSMPLVEALSAGLPVVGIRRAAFEEIAHGCALLVEEPAPELLADAMERVLTDGATRDRMRAASLERAKSYRWSDTARRTLDALRRAAAQ